MKKRVRVTVTKELDIEIPDEELSTEAIKGFTKHFFYVGSQDDMFEHAAQYVARLDTSFVEGIGKVEYTEIFEDVETEIIE